MMIAPIIAYLIGYLVGYFTSRQESRDLREKADKLERFGKWLKQMKGGEE